MARDQTKLQAVAKKAPVARNQTKLQAVARKTLAARNRTKLQTVANKTKELVAKASPGQAVNLDLVANLTLQGEPQREIRMLDS